MLENIEIGYRSWYILDDIKETKNSIKIYYKQGRWAKTKQNITFNKINENEYQLKLFPSNFGISSRYQEDIELTVTKDNICQKINELGGLGKLAETNDAINKFKIFLKQRERTQKRVEENKKNIKVGDIVITTGKTPNLGNYRILVDEINEYGVCGFYLDGYSNTKSREYVSKGFEYIKGVEKKMINSRNK